MGAQYCPPGQGSMRRPGECDPPGPGCPGGLGTMRAMEAAPPGPSLSVDAPDEAEPTGGATRGGGPSTSVSYTHLTLPTIYSV